MDTSQPDNITEPTSRGFLYFLDDERDYKIGKTNNPKRRLKEYLTENPRLKPKDCYEVGSYEQASDIEKELIAQLQQFQAHGKEWFERNPEVDRIWNDVKKKYARLTHADWVTQYSTGLENELRDQLHEALAEKTRIKDAASTEEKRLKEQLANARRQLNLVERNQGTGQGAVVKSGSEKNGRSLIASGLYKICGALIFLLAILSPLLFLVIGSMLSK
ncbi:MAG: GIY-YIG nuclease family protein [Pirellulales bacterium]